MSSVFGMRVWTVPSDLKFGGTKNDNELCHIEFGHVEVRNGENLLDLNTLNLTYLIDKLGWIMYELTWITR